MRLGFLPRHPSGVLLAVQLLGLLLYPLMDDDAAGRALFGTFGVLVLALALWVVNRSPTVNWIAWLLAAPAVLLSLLAGWVGQPQWLVWAHLLESALYFYAAARPDRLHAQRSARDRRRAPCRRRHLHAAGLGLRLRVLRLPDPVARAASSRR